MGFIDRPIIFWHTQPPKVELGAYNELSYLVKEPVLYVCLRDFTQERKKLGWDNSSYGKAELLILPENEQARQLKTEALLAEFQNAIHIVSGVSGPIADYICPKLKERKIQFCVVTERPRIIFDNFRDSIISACLCVKYGIVSRLRYNKSIVALLPFGQIGVDQFAKLGWDRNKIFNFMYCGEYDDVDERDCDAEEPTDKLRFLYIGRFGYNHALDVLMKAIDLLDCNDFIFDMAGGYGEKRDEVLAWIESNSQVNYIGSFQSSEVRELMLSYDCVIVPSRIDGWNCQVNEALSVGTPVITMKESVSSELVLNSGAGIVVNTQKPDDLMAAIKYAIDNRDEVKRWREKANIYKERFGPKKVGMYLYSILQYSYDEEGRVCKPECPWINCGEK